MTAYEKARLEIGGVEDILKQHFGSSPAGVMPVEGGNLSSVFSFEYEGRGCIIKLSDMDGAYDTEGYVANLLTSQGIPFAKCLGQGKSGTLSYSISERIRGGNLTDCSDHEKQSQLPELIEILTRMNYAELGDTSGYGWIQPSGAGAYPSWREYITSFFAEDQSGTFWEGWHGLFQSTCLEKDVFEECYHRLLAYAKYNEPHRYFIHGDFQPWNILSDGRQITGIIDGNFAYGDFLIDLATLNGTLGELDVVQAYQDYQNREGIIIPDFHERLTGARYFKGLDALRFYAKMGWDDAYRQLRDELLQLPE
ncbi:MULTISPECIES: phosphotransferase family protein [Paenibacillus]|uniref:phosphotransferase family protein n=1 Tax=Paenibacillus TaxID=44249 RepID=UPI0030085838